MPASTAYIMRRSTWAVITGAWLAVCAPMSASANVIADWDERAIAAVEPLTTIPSPATPYGGYRMMGMVHAAMPEYPCAHCILSGSVAGVVRAALGTEEIPEIAKPSPTAPGVTHRWTNMTAFTEEVANARIWSGFHYRFSTRVATQMGLQIGEYVVKNIMQPAVTAGPQQLPAQGLVPVGR
jgi:hypothetical protein